MRSHKMCRSGLFSFTLAALLIAMVGGVMPTVAMAASQGYWLVGGNGAMFNYNVGSRGSAGGTMLAASIVGIEAAGEVAPVPVPAAGWLFGSALAGLGAFIRLRRRSHA